MKPTSLKPGDRVRFAESHRVLTFIRREHGRPSPLDGYAHRQAQTTTTAHGRTLVSTA